MKNLNKIFILITIIFSCELMAVDLHPDLVKGDELYAGREKLDLAYQAHSLFQKYLDAHPNEVEGLWRASMSNYYIGHLLSEEKQRIRYYKKGVEQGKLCAKKSKDTKVECYFWLATNTALLRKDYGILSMAFGIGSIISLFEKALELDPTYAGAGPYRMLALLHYKAPGFLGGDVKKAYEYIKKAIGLAPKEPLNYYFLIKFLVEDKKMDEALSIARKFVDGAEPSGFTYFESKTAFKNINYFLKTKELPKND